MFTGLVEEVGEVVALERLPDAAVLTVRGPLVCAGLAPGDSVAVSGCCLTVTEAGSATFAADVMGETLARTTLGALRAGSAVNLERALAAGGRLGGHLVQGHVDGTGAVRSRRPSEHWDVVAVELPAGLARYVALKGSVAVDGVSLTVSGVGGGGFEVSLIPATLARTTLGTLGPGDQVNLEVDVLAKYVERLLEGRAESGLDQQPGAVTDAAEAAG